MTRPAIEQLRALDLDALKKLPPARRKKAESLLRQITEVRDRNPLAAFVPYPQQEDFLDSEALTKLFLGGNQTGKTTIGLVDDLVQAVDEDAVPSHLRRFKKWEPPFLCRIMTPDFSVTMEQVLHVKLRELAPKGQLVGDTWEKAYDKRLRVLRFKNGSWFQFATYEQELDKLGGATLDRVHYDESPPRSHRNESRIRLVRRGGKEIATLTPVEGIESWVFDEWYTPWEQGRADPAKLHVVRASMDDNPYLTAENREWVLSGLSPEEADARRRGLFVALHGLIYKEFSDGDHVIPYREPPLPWTANVIVGIDPGIRYAAGVVWIALTPENEMVVFEELKAQGSTVAEVAEQIHRINAYWEVKPSMYVIDPAARNTLHQTGRSDQQEYADHGIYTIAGQNDVRAGINRVRERLAYSPTRKPGLYIYDSCSDLLAELKRYRWKEPPKSAEETREAPVKRDDHLLDALRYAVMARPFKPLERKADDRTRLQKVMQDDIERAARPKTPAPEFGAVV